MPQGSKKNPNPELMKMPKYKICLDAGHYGKYNQSPGVPEYYESEMTWKLHLLLKKHLEARGFDVITTRSNQEKDIALQSRGKKSKGCDLFISIHSNAVGSKMNESVDYPIVYVPISGEGDEIGKKLASCIAETMGTKQEARCKTKKGASGDYYGVMRGAASVGTTALLVEHSFHTNTNAAKWLLNEDNLYTLAEAEAACIAAHFGGNTAKPEAIEKADPAKKGYIVRITADELNVRAGAGLQYDIKDVVTKGEAFTIVETRGIWGKLKSGKGWISLKYTEKV